MESRGFWARIGMAGQGLTWQRVWKYQVSTRCSLTRSISPFGGIDVTHILDSKAARGLALLATLLIGSCAAPPADAPRNTGKQRPNFLLIISDDIGVDVTTDMSPGLIDGLLQQYGPAGHNHPKYQEIKGRPASTPSLNALRAVACASPRPGCSPSAPTRVHPSSAACIRPVRACWTTLAICRKTTALRARSERQRAATARPCSANGTWRDWCRPTRPPMHPGTRA